MARVETVMCDICGKPTERVALKMYISAVQRVAAHRSPHSDYTHHLDVGVCCEDKLMTAFQWRKRMSAEEYRIRRKLAKNGR